MLVSIVFYLDTYLSILNCIIYYSVGAIYNPDFNYYSNGNYNIDVVNCNFKNNIAHAYGGAIDL